MAQDNGGGSGCFGHGCFLRAFVPTGEGEVPIVYLPFWKYSTLLICLLDREEDARRTSRQVVVPKNVQIWVRWRRGDARRGTAHLIKFVLALSRSSKANFLALTLIVRHIRLTLLHKAPLVHFQPFSTVCSQCWVYGLRAWGLTLCRHLERQTFHLPYRRTQSRSTCYTRKKKDPTTQMGA